MCRLVGSAGVGRPHYLPRMDVLLWTGWLCTLIVLFFIVAIGVFGSFALKAPHWEREFQALARYDWMRRGLTDRVQSESEQLQMRRFIGDGQVAEAPDPAERTRIVRTIGVLVGEDDHETLQAQLDARSQVLLEAALTGVFASVANIANLDLASRVWAFRRKFALAVVLWRGLVWFAPRCFKSVSQVAERYLLVATILGITGGLLAWGFTHRLTDSGEAGVAWMSFVGVVVTVSTVVALVLALGRRFWKVAVTVIGPTSTWTTRGIVTAGLALTLPLALITLNQTGVLQQWQLDANSFATTHLTDTAAGRWIGGMLLVAIVGFVALRALRRAAIRRTKTMDRVGALGGAVVMILFCVLVFLFLFGVSSEVALPVIYVIAIALILCGAGQAVLDVVGWVVKYRALRDAGVDVRRGWFRWWILWTWMGLAAVVVASTSVPPVFLRALQATPYAVPWVISSVLVTCALALSFWPGVFTVARFVMRVHNTHARYEFEVSKARFEASLSTWADGARDPSRHCRSM